MHMIRGLTRSLNSKWGQRHVRRIAAVAVRFGYYRRIVAVGEPQLDVLNIQLIGFFVRQYYLFERHKTEFN